MEYKKPIMKEPGIDMPATIAQLEEVGDAVFIPVDSGLKPAAIRQAVKRANQAGGSRYSSHETTSGHLVIRKS